MVKKWNTMTEYDLLEVSEKATNEEIQYAWELQRVAWHPDRFPASFVAEVTERFKAIKEAYEKLSNPALRHRLDLSVGEDENIELRQDTQFELPEQRIPENWKRLSHWAKEEDKLSSASRGFSYKVADKYLEKDRALSSSQFEWAKKIWNQAIREGFDLEEEE
jgi:DnaJ-class molecular chaperone